MFFINLLTDPLNKLKKFPINIDVTGIMFILLLIILVIPLIRFLLSPQRISTISNYIASKLYTLISKCKFKNFLIETTRIIFEVFATIFFTILALIKITLKSWWLLFIIGLLSLLSVKFLHINLANLPNLYKIIGIYYPNDKLTLDLISSSTQFIKFMVPLSIPFFYFIYREQKNVSESSLNLSENYLYLAYFLLTSVSTLWIGTYTIGLLSSEKLIASQLTFTHKYATYIGSFSILLIFSFLFLLKMTFSFFGSIKVEQALEKKIKKIRFNYLMLTYCKFPTRFLYKRISYQIDSIYQMITYVCIKDLGKTAEMNLEEWFKNLHYILNSPRMNTFDPMPKHDYLISKHSKNQLNLYNTILQNHISLIIKLIKDHKFKYGKKSINELLEYIPLQSPYLSDANYNKHIEKMTSLYFINLNTLALFLFERNDISTHLLLDKIEKINYNLSDSQTEGILRTYISLIIKALEKNDVSSLSNLCYSLIRFITKDNESDLLISDSSTYTPEELAAIQLFSGGLEDIQNNSEHTLDISTCIYLILQAISKSMELSLHNCTGFLVKFLVTSFEDHQVESTFRKFSSNYLREEVTNKTVLDDNPLYFVLENDFRINPKVSKYFLYKLTVLILGQQKYIKKHNVNIWKIPHSTIDVSFFDCEYLDYIFKKLRASKDKYGLSYMQSEKFMNTLYIELRHIANKNKQAD
ncbi:hypothetical protein [Bacillus cereus]|uniref:hypothetical protein n=1 Tax=Bacillus cereus TaxID=1396 RepID=UPI003D66247D